jgi:CMP-N,N'-diacetyllegionaminic acid synthase
MIENKKILSVITARAGSKVIKGKNHRKICGQPLFLWSVLSSQNSKYIDLIVVSSNCKKVKSEFDKFSNSDFIIGDPPILFIQRPEEFSTDTSKNEEALIHAYEYCKNEIKFDSDIIINLQPTSPIRSDKLIDRCIEKFSNDKADSLFTANRHTPFFCRIENNEIIFEWDYRDRPMRQNIKNWKYHDNGNVYVMSKKLLLENKCRMGGKTSLLETNKYQSLQIDLKEDFVLIEKIVEGGFCKML